MAEAHEAGMAENEVEAECGDCEDHHARHQIGEPLGEYDFQNAAGVTLLHLDLPYEPGHSGWPPAVAIHQRSDVCAVPRAGVVLESVVALILADAALEKFGGDSLVESKRNADAYLTALEERW